MPDTKISGLAAATSLADADLLALVQGGVSKSTTLNLLTAYLEQRARQNNGAIANQTFAATDTYVTGSDVTIPTGRLQAKTVYRMRMQLTKTSTTGSTATPIVTVRIGTAGTTADTARVTLTFAAQTAVADVGFIDVYCTFRAVGSGTTAVLQGAGVLDHQLAATGLANTNTSIVRATSTGFDSTVAGLKIGCSFNGGTSFAGNTDLVQAELANLA